MSVIADAIDWRAAAAAKAAEQDGRIAALPASLFTADIPSAAEGDGGSDQTGQMDTVQAITQDLEYLSASARQITENIGAKKQGWTAVRVMEAYVRSAIRAHMATNCLTEMLFSPALDRARALDEEFAATGKVKGPLHGVPVSIKDQLDIQGEDSTIGFTKLVNKPAMKNAAIVDLLLEAGAIPFTKTNVPQTMLAFECSNPLFGTTHNPYKHGYTCGGSSGGEASLVSADGSPLGIGSDIGGSLRIPGHYSGCYGLKPCAGRFPAAGAVSPNAGFEAIHPSLGPMGRCADDLELAAKTILSSTEKLWRQYELLPIPWRPSESKLPKKLKFGYFLNDEIAKASPACQRAVKETVQVLRKAGHEIVEIDVAKLEVLTSLELFVGLTSADGYATLMSGLHGDPRESSLFLTTLGPRLPWPVRSLVTFLLRNVVGDKVMAQIIASARTKSVKELMVFQDRRQKLADRTRAYLWKDLQLDALLCPTQAMPALKNGSTWNRSMLALGTFLFNTVDATVGQIPVTFVDPNADVVDADWEKQPTQSPLIHRALYGENGAGVYDPKEMAGLPVGIQVVGSLWQEERILAILKVVEKALGDRGFGPGKFAKRMLDAA